MGVSKARYLLCAPAMLATVLLSAAASAEPSHDVFAPHASHNVSSHVVVAQTSHAPPVVPGSTGSGGASNGSHAPPPVPGSTDSGGASSGGSHAPPLVPGAAASSGGNAVGPNGAGASHAPPQVPMMGGNP